MSGTTIEVLFRGPVMVLPDEALSLAEQRLRAIGRDNEGRYVFVVFTVREKEGHRLIRPINARFMHKREIEAYEAQNPDLSD